MSDAIARRLDAAMGTLFALLITIALALPGRPPKAEDPVGMITSLLVDRRSAFLIGGYLAGLAAMAYLWFLGSVRDYLGRDGGAEFTAAASAGGVFAITVMVVGMMIFSGVAFVAARLGDAAVVRALTDIGTMAIEISKFGFAVFLLAVSRAGASRGLLPRWLVRFGVASVPLMLVSAVSLFVDRGMLQFGGVVDLAGGLPPLLWIVGLSLVMMRSASPPEAAKGIDHDD